MGGQSGRWWVNGWRMVNNGWWVVANGWWWSLVVNDGESRMAYGCSLAMVWRWLIMRFDIHYHGKGLWIVYCWFLVPWMLQPPWHSLNCIVSLREQGLWRGVSAFREWILMFDFVWWSSITNTTAVHQPGAILALGDDNHHSNCQSTIPSDLTSLWVINHPILINISLVINHPF